MVHDPNWTKFLRRGAGEGFNPDMPRSDLKTLWFSIQPKWIREIGVYRAGPNAAQDVVRQSCVDVAGEWAVRYLLGQPCEKEDLRPLPKLGQTFQGVFENGSVYSFLVKSFLTSGNGRGRHTRNGLPQFALEAPSDDDKEPKEPFLADLGVLTWLVPNSALVGVCGFLDRADFVNSVTERWQLEKDAPFKRMRVYRGAFRSVFQLAALTVEDKSPCAALYEATYYDKQSEMLRATEAVAKNAIPNKPKPCALPEKPVDPKAAAKDKTRAHAHRFRKTDGKCRCGISKEADVAFV